jgi:ABC-type branched-subunit amino acid transport system ATPase component
MPVLWADSVTAGYGGVPIVQGVTAGIDEGKITALVGPNGAGKSTFLKSLFGLIPKTGGKVHVAGRDVTHWRPHVVARNGVAYVPQVENIFPSLSIQENLEIGGYVQPKETRKRALEVLEIFPDLRQARRVRAGTLSGGQKNMLALARGLMLKPKVVLLDEPTAGLSPAYTAVVWKQIKSIAESGAGVMVVEQNVDLAISHANYVYVLVAGRNRLEGPAHDMRELDLGSIFLGREEQITK